MGFDQDYGISNAVTDDAFDQAFASADSAPAIADNNVQDAPVAADTPASSSEDAALPQTEEVTGTPAPQAETVVETEQPTAQAEENQQPAPETQEADTQPDEKLNWESAPKAFRESYEAVKTRALELEANSLQNLFLTDEQKFLETVNDISPSQFEKTARALVQVGIEQHPADFANYLAQVAPDAAIAAIIGIDGVTAADARRIVAAVKNQGLEDYIFDGYEAAQDQAEAPQIKPESQIKTAEQRLAEYEQREQQQRIEALEGSTYAEIMSPIERMLDDAGFKILDTDSAEVRADKEYDREKIISETFKYLLETPDNKPLADKMLEFIKKGDEKAVRQLTPRAKLLAEDFAGKRVEQRSRARAASVAPRTAPAPPPVVKTATAVPPLPPQQQQQRQSAAPVDGNQSRRAAFLEPQIIADAITDDAFERAWNTPGY